MGSARREGIFSQLTSEYIISTVVIIMITALPLASSQAKVNLMLLYEDPNTVKSFDEAVKYVKNNPALGYSTGEIWRIQSNGTDGSKLIMSLCKDIDAAYKMPAGQQPDIVVDFTRTGIPSEAVKLITKTMTIPTISGSFGQEGDIRSWRDLTENAKNYLIQIAPPADMVAQAVRSLVSQQDLTSAGFLYDDEYEMCHKRKSLLKYFPTKHNFTKLGRSTPKVLKQIENLVHENISNFFIGASPNKISDVLAEVSDFEMEDEPYFGDDFTWYSMSMEPGFPRCCGCKNNISVIHLSPVFSKESNKRWDDLSFKKQKLMEMFYFDLTMNAIATVAKMKTENTWKAPPKRICKEIEAPADDAYNLALFDTLASSKISTYNLLGPFYLDADKTMGRSHSNFKMSIHRLVFQEGERKPVSMKQIGVWTTGFVEKELITVRDKEEAEWKAHIALQQTVS